MHRNKHYLHRPVLNLRFNRNFSFCRASKHLSLRASALTPQVLHPASGTTAAVFMSFFAMNQLRNIYLRIVLRQIFYCLAEELFFPMVSKMYQMRLNGIFSLRSNICHNFFFIILFRFPFFNNNCVLRTMAKTGPESVTEKIGNQAGFTVYYLKCSFRAIWNTKPASRTFIRNYFNYLPFRHISSRPLLFP